MNVKSKRINLKVPLYTHEWLKQKSSEYSLTMTELINRILYQYIKEQDAVDEPKQF